VAEPLAAARNKIYHCPWVTRAKNAAGRSSTGQGGLRDVGQEPAALSNTGQIHLAWRWPGGRRSSSEEVNEAGS